MNLMKLYLDALRFLSAVSRRSILSVQGSLSSLAIRTGIARFSERVASRQKVAKLACLLMVITVLYVKSGAQSPPIRPVPKAQPNTQAPPPQPDKQFTAPVPNVSADLTATRTTNPEFRNYVKQLGTGSAECYFKLTTGAADAQKIVWQMGNAPFAAPKTSADWKTPAGLIASGATAAAKPATEFTINLLASLGQPTGTARRVYVRALVIKNNLLAAQPSNLVVIDYATGAAPKDPVKPQADNLPKTPGVYASVSIVGYKPAITQGDPYAFILTQTPPTGELKLVLQKINATTPGTKFHLSPDEYAKLKQSFSFGENVQVAAQEFLKVVKSGYNWLDDKYNFAANKLAGALAPIVGQQNARKIINYYMALYGMNPSYGNFDETLDTAGSAFSAFIMDSGDVPEEKKGSVTASATGFINEVKNFANGGGDPNRFYRQNPEFAARPAIVILRVKYQAVNGASADVRGGKTKLKVSIMSGRTVDKSTLTSSKSGYAEYPPVLLFEKAAIEVPNARPGTVLDIPVYVGYAPLYTSDNFRWQQGYNSLNPAEITAGNDSIKVVATKKYSKQ